MTSPADLEEKDQGSSGAEIAALLPSEASCSAAQSGAGEGAQITLAQLERGIAALDKYRDLVRTVYDAFLAADEDRVDGLGGSGLVSELTRQLEERCNDPTTYEAGGSMIEYMLYEGRSHGGRCVAADGREMAVDSPAALWEWWRHTKSGPFTPPSTPPPLSARPGEGGPALTLDETNSGGCDE